MLSLRNPSIQRAAIFAHFDIDNRIDDYVVYYLKKIREVCTFIIFVTTSELSEKEISKIDDLCARIIVRENRGHDFMSYKQGLTELDVQRYDEILLCNDSVYGPLFSLKYAFASMQRVAKDFWGMTANSDLAYHIQSYFVVFRKKVILSNSFREFWENVSVQNDKSAVINKYELGLTQSLIKAGFMPDSYVKIKSSFLKTLRVKIAFMSIKNCADVINKIRRLTGGNLGINPTHVNWKELIADHKMPFIKVAILRDNFKSINTEEYPHIISNYTNYDISLIKRHLDRVKGRYSMK